MTTTATTAAMTTRTTTTTTRTTTTELCGTMPPCHAFPSVGPARSVSSYSGGTSGAASRRTIGAG
jgi:hypothetical protein